MALFTFRLAEDKQVLGSVQNAFELQACILITKSALIFGLGLLVGPQEDGVDLPAYCQRPDDDKARGLHQSDRGRVVSGSKQTMEQGIRQGLGQKAAADIATRTDHPVN